MEVEPEWGRSSVWPACSAARATVLEGAGGGGADGEDAAAIFAGEVEGVRGASGKGVELGVEADVSEVFDADWLKGAEADVEGEELSFNAAGAELGEDFGGEVEAGGGGGGGAEFGGGGLGGAGLPGRCLLRVNGLVALLIVGGIGGQLVAADVGRQGHVSDLLDSCEEVGRGDEHEGALAEAAGGDDLGLEERLGETGGVELEAFTDLDLAGGAAESAPDELAWVPGAEVFGEKDLDAAGRAG